MIDIKNYSVDYEETMIVKAKNGEEIVVKGRIPYEEKELFASELVDMTLGTNRNIGVCVIMPNYLLVRNYLFIKHYTNQDVSWAEQESDWRMIFDFAQDVGLLQSDIGAFVKNDLMVVDQIEALYRDATTKVFEAENSLGTMAKQWMSTDIDTSNEEARELIEKLIDMKGALMEKENKPANGMSVDGAIINFAKR